MRKLDITPLGLPLAGGNEPFAAEHDSDSPLERGGIAKQ